MPEVQYKYGAQLSRTRGSSCSSWRTHRSHANLNVLSPIEVLFCPAVNADHDLIGAELNATDLHVVARVRRGAAHQSLAQILGINGLPYLVTESPF